MSKWRIELLNDEYPMCLARLAFFEDQAGPIELTEVNPDNLRRVGLASPCPRPSGLCQAKRLLISSRVPLEIGEVAASPDCEWRQGLAAALDGGNRKHRTFWLTHLAHSRTPAIWFAN